MIRPVTENLYESLMMDVWPRAAAICDFGIASDAHYRALHAIVRAGTVTRDELDRVLGDGPAITALVNASPSNPVPGIVFKTAYDDMSDE